MFAGAGRGSPRKIHLSKMSLRVNDSLRTGRTFLLRRFGPHEGRRQHRSRPQPLLGEQEAAGLSSAGPGRTVFLLLKGFFRNFAKELVDEFSLLLFGKRRFDQPSSRLNGQVCRDLANLLHGRMLLCFQSPQSLFGDATGFGFRLFDHALTNLLGVLSSLLHDLLGLPDRLVDAAPILFHYGLGLPPCFFGLGEGVLDFFLPFVESLEQGLPGKQPQDRQQNHEDDDRPDHQPGFETQQWVLCRHDLTVLLHEDDDKAHAERDDGNAFQQEQRKLKGLYDVAGRLGLAGDALDRRGRQAPNADAGADDGDAGADGGSEIMQYVWTRRALLRQRRHSG